MAHYSLRAWEAHQHYKDRNPPWVKLYRDTLTTESWVMGSDLSRLVQVASILLAARYNNEIPLNFTLLSRVASLDCTAEQFSAALDHLARFQFIEIHGEIEACKQDASNALATCAKQNESLYLEESRGEERRVEGEAASAAPPPVDRKPAKKATRLPDDFTPSMDGLRVPADFDQQAELAKFRDYWVGAPKGTKADWPATWRNWVRRAVDEGRYSRHRASAVKWQ